MAAAGALPFDLLRDAAFLLVEVAPAGRGGLKGRRLLKEVGAPVLARCGGIVTIGIRSLTCVDVGG